MPERPPPISRLVRGWLARDAESRSTIVFVTVVALAMFLSCVFLYGTEPGIQLYLWLTG